jgi:UDP-glucose 4-epimerase
MDFVHVRDVAKANILGAKTKATDEVFNVATGTETSLLQLATALASVMGRRGLTPLEQGLADLVKWWRVERDSLSTARTQEAVAS